ncbi:fimbrial protein [Aeromonas sp. CA23]|uniref:fimbrial protein n=1 Tax=Aeromonas sp. CA23 TaxID=2033032 RepID=UPI000BFE4910|nr:fimbrial protein [Aeromonas sp. CA23]ATM00996.1 fimbrial protein [Aeromonas sp. CA23]
MSVAKISVMATVVVVSASMNANATSGNTIQFIGEVSEQTCSVTVDGQSSTPVVVLPNATAEELKALGDTAHLTRFTIGVTGCAAPVSVQNFKTLFVGNNLTVDGRLGNTGTAGNVTLQVVDPDASTIQLDLTGKGIPGLVLQAGETAASHDFAVQYYAEGRASGGSVLGSLQYAVSYL